MTKAATPITASPSFTSEHPSPWVQRFAPLIAPGAVLDLACGAGRHSRLLAALGHEVHALDRDAKALALLGGASAPELRARLHPRQIDLEVPLAELQWPFAAQSLAGIVVTNYLHRALFALLFDSLAENGVFIMETFALGNEKFGRPANPDFLLRPAELIGLAQAAPGMRILAFEDGRVLQPKEAMVQRICAIKQQAGEEISRLGPI